MLALACLGHGANPSLDYLGQHYSRDLYHLVALLLTGPDSGGISTARQVRAQTHKLLRVSVWTWYMARSCANEFRCGRPQRHVRCAKTAHNGPPTLADEYMHLIITILSSNGTTRF